MWWPRWTRRVPLPAGEGAGSAGAGRVRSGHAGHVAAVRYAHGVRSSRQIERLCVTDVAFRVVCAQDVPDHSTVARFRSEHEQAFKELFEQVLIVCARAGLGRVGSIAVDGTKIAANASIDANRTEDTLRAVLEAEIEREVEQIVGAAVAADAAEDALFGDKRGDELPPSMRGGGNGRGGRRTRIRECLAQLETETTERVAEQTAADAKALATLQAARDRVERAENEARAKMRAWQATWAGVRPIAGAGCRGAGVHRPASRTPSGFSSPGNDSRRPNNGSRNGKPGSPRRNKATVKKKERRTRRTITDPDSRIMKTRTGWVKGYNAQLAVTDDHLILAAAITQDTVDVGQAEPMTTAALNAAALLEQHHPSPPVSRRTASTHAPRDRPDPVRRRLLLRRQPHRPRPRPAHRDRQTPRPDPRRHHQPRQRTTTRRRHRDPEDEPPAPHPRRTPGLQTPSRHRRTRQRTPQRPNRPPTFSRRGLTAATSELNLAAAVVNLLKLRNHTHQPAT